MRLVTIQIDLDKLELGLSELEPTLNRMLATIRLRGVPLVDGIAHTLKGERGQHLGYWSIQPNKKKEKES